MKKQQTCDDSSNDELCERVAGGLQNHADEDHDGAPKGSPFPSIPIAHEEATQRAHSGTDFVKSYCSSLDCNVY